MATPTLVPLEVYLHTDYRPDCDWIDGEVKGRNTGEGQHASVQKFFIRYFGNRERELGVRVWPEQRVQVAATRFRVADVTVMRESDPFEAIITVAPAAVHRGAFERAADERDRGAGEGLSGNGRADGVDRHPLRRTAFSSDANGQRQVSETLELPGKGIRVTLAEVFAELDELEGRK